MNTQNAAGRAPNGRPVLGDIKPGDLVFVRGSERYIPARVVKAARVWIELEATGDTRSWRMRRDTQEQATQYSGSSASFVTAEQRAWDERLRDARKFLNSQGIRVERYVIGSGNLDGGGPWWGREIELADLIRREIDATP